MNKVTLQAFVLSCGLVSCGAWGMQESQQQIVAEPTLLEKAKQNIAQAQNDQKMNFYTVPLEAQGRANSFGSYGLTQIIPAKEETIVAYTKPKFKHIPSKRLIWPFVSQERWEYEVTNPSNEKEMTYSFDRSVANDRIEEMDNQQVWGHKHQRNLLGLIKQTISEGNNSAKAISILISPEIFQDYVESKEKLTSNLAEITLAEKSIHGKIQFLKSKNNLSDTANHRYETMKTQYRNAQMFFALGGIGLLSLCSSIMRKPGTLLISLACVGTCAWKLWQAKKTSQNLDNEITPSFNKEKEKLNTQQTAITDQKQVFVNHLRSNAQKIEEQYAKLQDAQNAMAEIKLHERMLIEEAAEALKKDTTNNVAAQTAKMYHDFWRANRPASQ